MPAFRRMKAPALVPVGVVAGRYDVPADLISADINAFMIVNSNQCWVRLLGSRETYAAAAETFGWLIPPGFVGVFGTQRPEFMSAIAVARDGYPLTGLNFVPLEISYGVGE